MTAEREIEIEEDLAIRTWYLWCRTFVFFFLQFFTLCTILTLSVVNSGAISFIYTIFALYYIYKARTFYENNKTGKREKWSFPRLLRRVLLPYLSLDLLAQFIYQIPISVFYEDQKKLDSPTRIIGLFQIWFYNSDVELVRMSDLMWYVALKGFIFTMILLQISVFDSDEYKEFIYTQLVEAEKENQIRGTCMTYQFNNRRLTKVSEATGKKHKIAQNLGILRQRLFEWNQKYFHDKGFSGFKAPTRKEAEKLRQEVKQRRGASQAQYKLENQNYEEIKDDDEKVLKLALKKAPLSVKIYIWAHKNLTNPIVSQKGELLELSRDRLERGTLKALSEMEYMLIEDYRSKQKHKQEMSQYEEDRMKIIKGSTEITEEQLQIYGIEDQSRQAPGTGRRLSGIIEESEGGTVAGRDTGERHRNQELADLNKKLHSLKKPVEEQTKYKRKSNCKDMCNRFLILLGSILIANTDAVCYLFMFINHMVNADLLSLVFPVAILGYALIQNPRPPQRFWKFILIYAEVVIFIKFVLRFQIWELIRQDLAGYHDSYLIGIKFYFDVSEGEFFRIIIMDTLTILSILVHQFALIRLGIWDKTEPHQEPIGQAILRILRKGDRKDDDMQIVNLALGDLQESRAERAHSEILSPNYRSETRGVAENLEDMPEDAEAMQAEKRMVRFYSDSNLKELSKLPDWKIDQWHNEMEQLKKKPGAFTRFKQSIARSLFKSSYLSSLFPNIREEKPGYDYFPLIMVPLFLTLLFTIFFYSKMAGQYLNFSLSLSYNQFSAGMVLSVIFQIFHIVMERFFYLLQKSLKLREEQLADERNQEDGSESKLSSSKSQSVSGLRAASMRADSLALTQSQRRTSSIRMSEEGPKVPNEEDKEGEYTHLGDRITYIGRDLPQLCKLFIFWLLIVFLHIMIFWVFPLTGNENLQAHIWCDEGAGVPCNSFQHNWALILIYLIYLAYFIFTALQIRSGLPQIRDINSITKQDAPINKYIYKVYLAIPFLWELRTITDWTFTRTALDLFQWFKYQDIYNNLFISKVETKQYRAHKFGQPRGLSQKFGIGCCMLFFLLLLIILPMIIFSGLNPIAQNNNVTGAQTNFRLLFGGTNSYNIFSTSHTSSISVMNDEAYKVLHFNEEPQLRAFPRKQIQIVETNESSDNMLELTSANNEIIINRLNELTPENILDKDFQVVMDYKFIRPVSIHVTQQEPVGSQAVEKHVPYQITKERFYMVDIFKRAFNQSECVSNIVVSLPDFYIPTIRLTSHTKPKLIDVESLRTDIYLNLTCQVKTVYLSNTTMNQSVERFWSAGVNATTAITPPSTHKGLVFFTVSDKVTSSLISYSVLTFYISVVFVVGSFLRSFFSGTAYKVVLQEMPYPDDLILICEGIQTSRVEENFKRQDHEIVREQELYYVLIEILRSPEMIRAITKSSLRKTD